jgi:DnaJ-class molecular chaperone
MSDLNIKTQCPRCLGSGSEAVGQPPFSQTCSECTGNGYLTKDKLDTTDIMAVLTTLSSQVNDLWTQYVTPTEN